ncbi:alpha/beta fold hydrolase [Nocardioides daphniae]|uniref:Alpha/beta hydrolase n=1 Tax=Nocardioides daphniae TaxID=402297 RepID=A0A4P7UE90_9ACTN|nr:alpha/beta hydrolase [Nocardioides daphniae]QCC78204.1 alpha/beta hydrolase [Nocardioides daphniae]GGD20974.1 esterase [Nocardioides daphniae]
MDIVLVPGLWLDASAWDAVTAQLTTRGHQVSALTLPGQGDDHPDATLDDQVDAVVAAVESAEAPPLVVGHSAASTLAWLAADRRPDQVAAVALVGGFPATDGTTYADFFPAKRGKVAFPGWEPFEGPDTVDLDAQARARIASGMHPVPHAVTSAEVRYRDERRHGVPLTLVCPEYTPDQARSWVEAGEVPEAAAAQRLDYVDIDSGHWPMYSAPQVLADLVDGLTHR